MKFSERFTVLMEEFFYSDGNYKAFIESKNFAKEYEEIFNIFGEFSENT